MSGLRVTFEDDGTLSFIDSRMAKLGNPNMRDLLSQIGAEVEAQTRTRIQDEKRTPDGQQWDPWSEEYAGSQHGPRSHAPHSGDLYRSGGHSQLQLTGALMDSLQYEIRGKDVLIGSNLAYSRVNNSQRRFLGLGDQNRDDVEKVIVGFFEDLLS